MAAKRCGKVFTKSDNHQPRKNKQGGRTRQAVTEQKESSEQQDEALSDREREEIMLKWAVSGFKPSGPKGFAPTESIYRIDLNCTHECSVMES